MEVRVRAAQSAFLFLTLTGCFVSSGQGDLMRQDIDSLRGRVESMEKRDQDITTKVVQLRRVLDEATALLGRNSADLGAKVARNESDIALAIGRIEEAKFLMAELQKQVAEVQGKMASLETTTQKVTETQQRIVDKVAPNLPDDKESLWKEAQTRLANGQREEARRFLRSFIQRFPDDPRTPTAQLQIGISFVQEIKYSNAVGEFSTLIQRFPKSPDVPEAMYQLAESFIVLKFCSDARATLQDLIKRYPRSPRAVKVRERLRYIQKISRDKNLCTS
jgi:tol-pal system protein YbgF